MADSDVLRPYKPADYQLDDSEKKFLRLELAKISASIALLVQVAKKLDARCVAGGI